MTNAAPKALHSSNAIEELRSFAPGVSRETGQAAEGEIEAPVEYASLRSARVSASLAELAACDASPIHLVAIDNGFQWFTNAPIARVFAGLSKRGGETPAVEVVG